MKETAAARPGGRHRAGLRALPAPDLPFLVLVLTLVGFGLVMLGSASGAVALYRRGDAFAYLRPQLLYAALGIAGMGLASRVDYHIFHKLAWPLLGVSLLLLTAVLFMPEYNGCKRWLVLPGLGTLQPSEIAKFAVVLVFAHIISLNHDRMQSFAVGVLPFALVLGVVAALMLLEPHLSGTLLILGIGAVLMFVGGTGLRWFVLAGVGGAGAIAAAVVIMPDLVPYAADRLRSWQDPFADPLGDGHQTIQSLYAIGSGGAAGLGLGNSRQKHLFVPEPQNDFIFSIVCEELGFIGACAVVGLFVLLLWLFLYKTPYGFWLRASGEKPETLRTAGIDPAKLKWLASILCGVFCALAGAHLSLGQLQGTFAENMSNNRGYIAFACVIFGAANPPKAYLAALMFGFFDAIGLRLQEYLSADLTNLIPYVITVVMMVYVVVRAQQRKKHRARLALAQKGKSA